VMRTAARRSASITANQASCSFDEPGQREAGPAEN